MQKNCCTNQATLKKLKNLQNTIPFIPFRTMINLKPEATSRCIITLKGVIIKFCFEVNAPTLKLIRSTLYIPPATKTTISSLYLELPVSSNSAARFTQKDENNSQLQIPPLQRKITTTRWVFIWVIQYWVYV